MPDLVQTAFKGHRRFGYAWRLDKRRFRLRKPRDFKLVHIGGSLYVHVDNEPKLREIVTGLIQAQGGATVAQVRESLGSSRKYVVPFLEYLDRVGVTRRKGDLRVLA